MKKKMIKTMIDSIEVALDRFRQFSSDNYYCTTTKGKGIPLINTLKDLSCYATIPSDGTFQSYRLKSHIKTSLGYCPAHIVIKDIPFTYKRFRLIIAVALPKVIYGHNLLEIYEYQWQEVIDGVYTMLLQFGIEIDKEELADTPHIQRIDFCKNILIKTPIHEFIALLQKFKKPRAKTDSRFDTTVSYGTRKKRLVIYDKSKEIIARASKNPESITYKLAKLLQTLEEISQVHIIRVEQRLYGKQAIAQELKGVIDPQDITFKTLFSEKVASHILARNWGKLVHEEKFKMLLLGKNDLHTITTQITRIARQQKRYTINPFFVLYPKLLADMGEEVAYRDSKQMRKTRSIIAYKKELYELMKHLPMYDTPLFDYRTITEAIKNWKSFSLPIVPNESKI